MGWRKQGNPQRSIDCYGSTRQGKNCRRKISPKNRQAYLSGFCGRCTGKIVGPAAAVRQEALDVRQRLLSKPAAYNTEYERMREITAGLRDAGYSPEEAVRHLLDKVLDGSFDLWSAKNDDTSSYSRRVDVGYQVAAAVDVVAPLDDSTHHQVHVDAFDDLTASTFRAETRARTDVNIREAADLAEGFMRYTADREEAGRPPHTGLLAHLIGWEDNAGFNTSNGAPVWNDTVGRLLDGFTRRWNAGELTPATVPREHVCAIVTTTMRQHFDPQQMDAVMQVADAINDAEIAAGRPSVFEPDEGRSTTEAASCVGPVRWDSSFDNGLPPNPSKDSMSSAAFRPWSGSTWPTGRTSTAHHTGDYDPTLDWGAPHSVGKWLTLRHPPQSMLDLGAWHTEHAATVLAHPNASPQQRHIAEMTVRLDQRTAPALAQPERCQMRLTKDVYCQNVTTHPSFDGWCGQCTRWMGNVDLPANGSTTNFKFVRWNHQKFQGKQSPVVPTMLAAYRRQHIGVAELEGYAAGADRQPGGWTGVLRARGSTTHMGATISDIFGGHLSDERPTGLAAPEVGQVDLRTPRQVLNLENPADSTGDPAVEYQKSLFTGSQRMMTGTTLRWRHGSWSDTLLVDRHALRWLPGLMSPGVMFSDYSACPGETGSTWWDDPSRTVLISWEDWFTDGHLGPGPALQVWGGEHGQPAVYSVVPEHALDHDRAAQHYLGRRPTRALDAASESRLTPHPWTLTERGLLDPVSGHVQVPDTVPSRGGVAVCGIWDLDVTRSKFGDDEWVMLSGGDSSSNPQVSAVTAERNYIGGTGATRHKVQWKHARAPLTGVAAPMCLPGSPSNNPQVSTVNHARTVLVQADVLAAAGQRAHQLGSDLVAVAWDDGQPLPGEQGHRMPTVHVDCDPHSERSRLGITAPGHLLPVSGLVWDHDDPQTVETHLRSGDDPLDLRFNPSEMPG